MIVAIYLLAIVSANLLTAKFGPAVSIVNAFLLIGLDITLRDRLHDSWSGRNLVVKMGLLIIAGSVISYALNKGAGKVAIASSAAFAAAMICDAIVYTLLGKRHRLIKVNGSNIVSSAVDSIVFPTIAFGGLSIPITLAQFIAKTAGGGLWSLVTARRAIVATVLLIVAVPANAIEYQVLRDFDRKIETITLEQYTPGTVSNFFFVDVDIDGDGIKSIYGEAYASYGKRLHADIGLNGGLNRSFPLGSAFLIGGGIGPATAFARIDEDGNVDPQLTITWNIFHKSLEFRGFADYWRENGEWILLSEPQFWFNINKTFSIGGEVELSDNFAGSPDFEIRPAAGIRFKF